MSPFKIGTVLTPELLADYVRRQEEFIAEAQRGADSTSAAFNAYQDAHETTRTLVPILSWLSLAYGALGLAAATYSYRTVPKESKAANL